MIKIRSYEHTDHYILENLMKANYQEKKAVCPESAQIFETIKFFTSFPQCGKIYMIFCDSIAVGYSIVINIWKNRNAKISYFVEELYINKEYSKQKLEIDLVDFLIKTNSIHGITLNFDELSSSSKKVFKSVKFNRDKSHHYYKSIEI